MSIFLIQGVYYCATGVWPLVHLRSFEFVTGDKTDHWLVHTVGALIFVIGLSLISTGISTFHTASSYILSLGSASVLATVDFFFVARKVIRPIYLLDGIIELLLIVAALATTESS